MEAMQKIALKKISTDFISDGLKKTENRAAETKTPDAIQKVKTDAPAPPANEDELYGIDSDICDDFDYDATVPTSPTSPIVASTGAMCDRPTLPVNVSANTEPIINTGTGIGTNTSASVTAAGASTDISNEEEAKLNVINKQAKQTAQELYEDIHAKKYGIFDGTSDALYQNIMDNVTSENVSKVSWQYLILGDKTLVDDIFKDGTLNKKEKGELAKHIANCYIENAKTAGAYTDDLSDSLETVISKETNRILGSMNASGVNKICDEAFVRRVFKKHPEGAPNGKIDMYSSQGQIGDCWVLASIQSIVASPKGAEILNNCLKINENGSVDVTLKGAGKTYNVMASELLGDNINYSKGDKDILAIEIAMNKYTKENPMEKQRINTIEKGGRPKLAFELLTGKNAEFVSNDEFKEISKDLIEKCKNDNFICSVASCNKMEDCVSAVNQWGEEVKLVKRHAYSLINADDDYVYLVNPWYTVEKLKLEKDKFSEFFNQADFADLSKE